MARFGSMRSIAKVGLQSHKILEAKNPIDSLYKFASVLGFINAEGFRLPGKPFAFQLAELDTDWALSHHSMNLRTVGFQRVHPDLGIDYLTLKRHAEMISRPLCVKGTEVEDSEDVVNRQLPRVAMCYTFGEGPFNGELSAQWRSEGVVETLKINNGDIPGDTSLETILASSNAPTGSIAQIMASAQSRESFGTLTKSSGRTRYRLSEAEREKFIKLTHKIKAGLTNGKYTLQEISQHVSVHRFHPMRMELCVANADDPHRTSLSSEGIWERFQWTINERTQIVSDDNKSTVNVADWQGPIRLRPY